VDRHRALDAALLGQQIPVQVGEDDVAGIAQGLALLDRDDRAAENLVVRRLRQPAGGHEDRGAAGAHRQRHREELRQGVLVDQPDGVVERLREHPGVHLDHVLGDDRVGRLSGFFRHGNQAPGVEDPERLAGTGAVDDGVVDQEAELRGKRLPNERLQGGGVSQQFIGGIAQADELLQVQLDLAELRLGGGLLCSLRLPVSEHASGPGRRPGGLVDAVHLERVGVSGDRDPAAALRQDAGLIDLLKQFGREVGLDQEAAVRRDPLGEASGRADVAQARIDGAVGQAGADDRGKLLTQTGEPIPRAIGRRGLRAGLGCGRIRGGLEGCGDALLPLEGGDDLTDALDLVEDLVLEGDLSLGVLAVLVDRLRVDVGRLLHQRLDVFPVLRDGFHSGVLLSEIKRPPAGGQFLRLLCC